MSIQSFPQRFFPQLFIGALLGLIPAGLSVGIAPTASATESHSHHPVTEQRLAPTAVDSPLRLSSRDDDGDRDDDHDGDRDGDDDRRSGDGDDDRRSGDRRRGGNDDRDHDQRQGGNDDDHGRQRHP